MNCKVAELYMSAMLDNQLSVKDGIEIIEHIENCRHCKLKWDLNGKTRARLKHHLGFIGASNNLKQKVHKVIWGEKGVFYLKSTLLAASCVFLLGLGLLVNDALIQTPHLHKLHNNVDFQLVSDDLDLLSNHLGVSLNKKLVTYFEDAMFKPHGAIKLTRPFNKNISLIALKNDKGQKISLCFLPKDYKVSNSNKTKINGITFHHGKEKNYNFAYWQQNEKTIALVSDNLSGIEMIDLAKPLMYEI